MEDHVDEEIKHRAPTCTDHCSNCGQHFSGLKAFDLHRGGSVTTRACIAGSELDKLQVWTNNGRCEIGKREKGRDVTLYGVTIWQVKKTEQQEAFLAGRVG